MLPDEDESHKFVNNYLTKRLKMIPKRKKQKNKEEARIDK